MTSISRAVAATLLASVFVTCRPAPVRADATAFIGATTTPANRMAKGLAVGAGLLVVGAEFEYSATSEETSAGAPSLRMGTVSGLLQTPGPIAGFQPYVITGLSLYRETLGGDSHTAVAPSTGGGVKISLAGPVRLRLDYRVFRTGSGARFSPVHRVYAGLNLRF
jgi:opacity protein-like surface antigen